MSTLISNLNYIESCKLDIKSAIEAKGVDMTGVSFPDYATAIENIPAGGITETLSVSSNGTYTPGAGVDGFSEVTVDVPQSVTGFTEKDITERKYNIANLSNSASFVSHYAFYFDISVYTVNLPNCEKVSSHAFESCWGLSSVSLPNVISIETLAFANCSVLTPLELPSCTSIAAYAFRSCHTLTTVSLPLVKTLGSWAFENCYNLSSVYIPQCTVFSSGAFSGCTSLTTLELSEQVTIYSSVFRNCKLLSGVWLYGSSVGVLTNTNAFQSTPIASGTGYIYVPASLVNTYKTAQNWSAYSDQILPIGGIPLSFSNGLLYGTLSEIDANYIQNYNLGITADDVISVSLPDCTFVGSSTFQSHYNLASVYMPSLTYVGMSGFRHCSALQSIDLPVCTQISTSAFIGCDLRSISAPNLVTTGSFTFGNNYNLSYVDLPAFEGAFDGQYLFSGTFNGCSSLSAVSLPALKDVGMRMFDSCNLYTITLPAAFQIRISAFNNNSNLSEIYLPGSYVCGLGNVNAFNGTPIASGTGSIYVPWSLVDTYKSRTNWSVFESQIYPIGGYPELSFSDGLLYGSCTAFDSASISALGISSADIVSIILPNFSGIQNPIPKFNHCENLLTVSLPAAEQIHFNMFDGCYSLYSVYIPMCREIGGFLNCSSLSVMSSLYNASLIVSNAFRGGGLTTITLETDSVVTLMSTDAFYSTPIWSGTGSIYVPYSLLEDYKSALAWSYYSSQIFAYDPPVEDLFFDGETGLVYGSASFIDSTYLEVLGITADQVTAVSLPDCTFVGSSTFKAHPNLVSVSLPVCTEVFVQGFSGCSQLQEAYLPNCTTLWGQAFFSCNALYSITLDNCEVVSLGAFRYCYTLTTLSLPKASILYGNCFANCSSLNELYLMGSSVVTLSAATAFTSCPATVFVPSSMYEGYLSAPVWSTITNRLIPVE